MKYDPFNRADPYNEGLHMRDWLVFGLGMAFGGMYAGPEGHLVMGIGLALMSVMLLIWVVFDR